MRYRSLEDVRRIAGCLSLAGLAVLVQLAGATGAAAATYWSAISTGCVPDAPSIQGNRYKPSSDTTIRHQGKNLKRISLICNVAPNPSGAPPNLLTLTYRDTTGTGTKAYVRAQLFSVDRATASKNLVASISSDTSSETVLGRVQESFVHTLDFNTNFYFVKIDMDRSASTQAVSAVGVGLDEDN